jgi:signal transduction histidine kinase
MSTLGVVRRNPLLLLLASATAATLLFISEGTYWRAANSLQRLTDMAQARTNIQALERGLLDAETGQRGYLLTHRKEYLRPYERALQRIDEALRQLAEHYDGDSERQAALATVRSLVTAKLAEMAHTIELENQGQHQAATDIVLSSLEHNQMEALRQASAELLAHESAKVAQGRAQIYQVLLASRVGVGLLALASLVGLLFYLRQDALVRQQQEKLDSLLQADHHRLELEVARRTAELTNLTQHLITAREDERSRLARDLHDELGALLTAAKLDAARIRSRLGSTAPEAQDRLAHLVQTLNGGIALKRRIIEDLRPSSLVNLGLVTTLEILVREFGERAGVQMHCELQPVALNSDVELVVYRLVQEAITNISKHARASQVWITLSTEAAQAVVTVRDDGVGFDTTAQPTSAHGLMGMRFRVQAEGGTLTVRSSPGQGTLIRVTLPLHAPA